MGHRKSQDTVVNSEGRKLLKFGDSFGLAVLNGRTKGDEEGKLTFVSGGGGCSVLDLIIRLEDEEEDVMARLEVITRTESDHLPVSFHLRGARAQTAKRGKKKIKKGTKRERLAWQAEEAQQYGVELNRVWETVIDLGPEKNWGNLKKAIWTAAGEVGMKRLIKEGRGIADVGWFDKECREQKSRK